jgi:hypothetical protein
MSTGEAAIGENRILLKGFPLISSLRVLIDLRQAHFYGVAHQTRYIMDVQSFH